jgi:hypothetical protein
MNSEFVPIFEVAYSDGMWWSLPQDLSEDIYEKYADGQPTATYSTNKGGQIREYCLDFETMEQINSQNDRRRTLRLAWVNRRNVTPSSTGQIPGARKRKK